MKRILSFVLSTILLCGCVLSFSSCGKKPSGVYVCEMNGQNLGMSSVFETYEFTRKSYKKTYSYDVAEFGENIEPIETGTYEIKKMDDGSLRIIFTANIGGEQITVDPVPYEKGDGYIMIDGIKYIKQKK